MPVTYQNPKGLHPYSDPSNNYTWIIMEAIELEFQTVYTRRGGGISKGAHADTFKFLAPTTLMDNITHEWTEYESVATRLANKIQTATKIGSELSAGKRALQDTIKLLGAGGAKGTGVQSLSRLGTTIVNNMVNAVAGVRVPKTRVDSPLVYSNSARREWNFIFNLVAVNGNPGDEVVKPIKELMKYSSPQMQGGQVNIGIKLPFIFRIHTSPGGLIHSENAALTAVQPTWKEPYMDGLPMQAELTLVFKDLSPLYRSTIETGVQVNVIESGRRGGR